MKRLLLVLLLGLVQVQAQVGVLDLADPVFLGGTVNDEVGGGGLSKTSLIAWYDFADATDSHSTHDLTEVNSPTYDTSPSRGIAAATGNKLWTIAGIIGAGVWLPDSSTDATMVVRFRSYTGVASGDYALSSSTGGVAVRYVTSNGIRGRIADASEIQSTTIPSEGTWYTVVLEYDNSAGDHNMWINNTDLATQSETFTSPGTALYFGGGTATVGKNMEIDFVGLFNRKLTTEEKAWVYNSGGTRTYAELSD